MLCSYVVISIVTYLFRANLFCGGENVCLFYCNLFFFRANLFCGGEEDVVLGGDEGQPGPVIL